MTVTHLVATFTQLAAHLLRFFPTAFFSLQQQIGMGGPDVFAVKLVK
jgi:hypothetical protein